MLAAGSSGHRATAKYFEQLLPQVTKILIVGWQAREAHFLQVLRGQHVRPLCIQIVDSDETRGRAVLDEFTAQLKFRPSKAFISQGGFTRFIAESGIDTFLSA